MINYELLEGECFTNYLKFLIGKFYKILPIHEENPHTLKSYLESLLIELSGNRMLIEKIKFDANFLTLMGTIQFLIDNECKHEIYKREVMKCINIIKKLQNKYTMP
jgi:hypothetical protein